ncbi:unnamed protein product [Effrenium voratum]|nr:unnamed protein product [Effrenium voratum]
MAAIAKRNDAGWRLVTETVPIREAERAVVELSGLFDCYRVSAYTPPEFCNGARHHQEMWEFPDDTRVKHCSFWSRVFDQDPALCRLSSQPNFQTWSPPFYLPPGSPTE